MSRPRFFQRRSTRVPLALTLFGLAVAGATPQCAVAAPLARADSLVPITIRFRATVEDAVFRCGVKYSGLGTSRATVVASDFRFYVHDVKLVTARGDTVRAALREDAPWQDRDVALLDFEDATASCANGTPETRDAVVVMAPAGTYRGVSFALGVPFERNHQDLASAPPPLSLSQLFWAWQSGHKFLRIDMRATAGDSAATPWVIHVGSAGCANPDPMAKSPAACSHPNRATVSLPGFDPKRDVVVADLAALLSRVDVRRNQPKTAAGCMSADTDSDCGGLFAALGLPHPSSTGTDTPQFFRVGRAGAVRVGSVK